MKKISTEEMKNINGGKSAHEACTDECSWWNIPCFVACDLAFDAPVAKDPKVY